MVVVAGILAAITWVIDIGAAAVGAKRVGASPWAIVGAAIGTIAGVFTGLVGLLFLPLAGAAIGEYLAKRDLRRAGHVGIATWLGLLIGTAAKVAIVFAMIGLFVLALVSVAQRGAPMTGVQIFILAVGCLALLLGALIAVMRVRTIFSGAKVKGTIVGTSQSSGGLDKHNRKITFNAPIVEFTHAGRKVKFTSSMGVPEGDRGGRHGERALPARRSGKQRRDRHADADVGLPDHGADRRRHLRRDRASRGLQVAALSGCASRRTRCTKCSFLATGRDTTNG